MKRAFQAFCVTLLAAELLVAGSGDDAGKRRGSVYLRRTSAGWRYDHEELGYEY